MVGIVEFENWLMWSQRANESVFKCKTVYMDILVDLPLFLFLRVVWKELFSLFVVTLIGFVSTFFEHALATCLFD